MQQTAKEFKSHIAFVFELYRRTKQMKRVATFTEKVGATWFIYDQFVEEGRRITLQRRDDNNVVITFPSRFHARKYLREHRPHLTITKDGKPKFFDRRIDQAIKQAVKPEKK